MSVATSLSDAPRVASPVSIRAEGRLAARFVIAGDRTVLADMRESGGYRLKFPRGADCEAVIVNTGGGVAGGDDLQFDFSCDAGAAATITSQAAEKLYRSDGVPVTMRVSLQAAFGATLQWLPQETILFDGARLNRRFDVALDENAEALIFESVTFGRLAMGETINHGDWHDSWRVNIGGHLAFADETRLGGDLANHLNRAATYGGAKAAATILLRRPDAPAIRDRLRDQDWSGVEFGFSVVNGLLVGRMLAHDPRALRATSIKIIELIRGQPVPRVFTF